MNAQRIAGVRLVWNLLCGFPNDELASYSETLAIVPLLTHLQPPSGMWHLSIDRFSPYFFEPARHGVTDVRPLPVYNDFFPAGSDINHIAYHFLGNYPCDTHRHIDVIREQLARSGGEVRWFDPRSVDGLAGRAFPARIWRISPSVTEQTRTLLVEALVHRQEGPRQELVENLVHKLHLVELQKLLDGMHPADVAYILEALPQEQRFIVWDLVRAERDGEILLEVSEAVRETLIAHMDQKELVAATGQLDTDEIADLAPDLPTEVMQDVFKSLSAEEREQLRAALSYPEDTVGALMDFDMVEVRDDVTLEVVLRYLRRLDQLPDHTDQLFVVDRQERLKGVLAVHRLLVTAPEVLVAEVMTRDVVTVTPETPIANVMDLLIGKMFKAVPIIDRERHVLGLITDGDLMARGGALQRTSVAERLDAEMLAAQLAEIRQTGKIARDVMTSPVIMVRENTSLAHAANLMTERNLKRLPVVDAKDRLGNLTLLIASENVEKSNITFDQWLPTRDKAFKTRHLIPDHPSLYKINRFLDFLSARDELIKSRLNVLLAAPAAAGDRR